MTLDELTVEIEASLSMHDGIDVQTYGEPRIKKMIQRQFNLLFDKLWWRDYMSSSTLTLDGTTGLITGDVSETIKRFKDIYAIWYESETRPLPLIPRNVNPTTVRRRAYAPHNVATKVFKVYPIDTTGSVTVSYRTKPDPFEDDTEITFDNDLLIYAACYMFTVEDDDNRAAAAMYKQLYDERYNDLRKANEFGHAMALDGYGHETDYLTEWTG